MPSFHPGTIRKDMEIVLIDSNQKEPMIQIDHFKAKLQSQKLRNFLLQYLIPTSPGL